MSSRCEEIGEDLTWEELESMILKALKEHGDRLIVLGDTNVRTSDVVEVLQLLHLVVRKMRRELR